MIKKFYLLAPGPTPVPEKALAKASEPIIHHRTKEFSDLFMDVSNSMKKIFGTNEDVYMLTSSGTGAMEAAVSNTLSSKDKVIIIKAGKFGERWQEICSAYKLKSIEVEVLWGDNYSKEQLGEVISNNPDAKAVLTTLSETSTGTVYDIKGYGEVVSKTNTLLIVDGISGVGAVPCPMDEWKVDILVTGSQKSLMVPPGLSYIALSQKAQKSMENSDLPKYYYDLKKYKKSLKKGTTPFTPAVSLVMQQKETLDLILSKGIENIHKHHQILAEATRAGIKALGLELMSESPGNVLTAVKVPQGIDGIKLVKMMQNDFKAHIAGGQASYKGEMFRIAHLGYMGGFDVITALSALEMTLESLGYEFEMGKGITAAQQVLKENWK